jgi:hypothetical protein
VSETRFRHDEKRTKKISASSRVSHRLHTPNREEFFASFFSKKKRFPPFKYTISAAAQFRSNTNCLDETLSTAADHATNASARCASADPAHAAPMSHAHPSM